MNEQIQEIWDWCDTMCMKHPWLKDYLVERAKEKIATLV